MPKSSRATTVLPIIVRELEVVRTVDVTPGMRRVTLTGAQLGEFTSTTGLVLPAFRSPGFDDDVKLIFPYPGEQEPVLPIQRQNGVAYHKGRRPLTKVYTVRRYDPATRELDVEFVKHGTGIATTWAYRAAPGDRIHMGGPSVSRSFPTAADWLLVAGDATALPAIARLLEEAPEDLRAQVFVEVAEDDHRLQLRELPGVEVTWLSRHSAEAGTTTMLLDAVRKADWWDGAAFAWVAGEQAAVRDIRRHLVEERAMAKEDIEFIGYWRRTEVIAMEGDSAVPDPDRNTAAVERFHDLTELVPPIAIRVAVGLGLGDLVSRGVTTVDALATATESDPRALGKLLRYLHAVDVLSEPAPGRYGLTEVGEFLTNENWINMLHPDGPGGRETAGIWGLGESVRTGKAAYASVTGQEFAALRREQWFEDKYLERTARVATWLAEPLARSSALAGIEHLVVHSGGAGAVAREITARHPHTRVTICALPTQADWLRRDLPASIPDDARRDRVTVSEQSIFEPPPSSDGVLLLKALASLPDADAVHALRRAAQNVTPGGRVLLVEDTFDTSVLDEHDAEADLFALTRDGSGHRTRAELDAVIHDAGLTVDRTEPIGWRTTLRVLR